MPPGDGRPILRELSKPQPQFLPLASPNGKHWDAHSSSSPREQQRRGSLSASKLLSRQNAIYWLVWLLVCGCFAIRHTTKLLDAAGQQHALLKEPTAAAAAGAGQAPPPPARQQQQQQQDDSSAGSTANSTTLAAAVLAAQNKSWPEGYVAVCAVIKDQWPDLRYWIEYHRWAGEGLAVAWSCSAQD